MFIVKSVVRIHTHYKFVCNINKIDEDEGKAAIEGCRGVGF